jgi:hypothetical protein
MIVMMVLLVNHVLIMDNVLVEYVILVKQLVKTVNLIVIVILEKDFKIMFVLLHLLVKMDLMVSLVQVMINVFYHV